MLHCLQLLQKGPRLVERCLIGRRDTLFFGRHCLETRVPAAAKTVYNRTRGEVMASTASKKRARRTAPKREPARIPGITPDELQAMIDESIDRKLVEWLGDPDEGLELRPEVIERIERHRKEYAAGRRGKSLEQVMKDYGVE
jgi:hypothetical protein